ncbi:MULTISPECIES: Ig-like domain-containing protein [unclassified Acidovorax]|uniref:Ig-like domain-containing protein n=1 Tax=unclassified Acidovorax TaxID=2684926 RepID=UPI001302F5A1|nr:MULTISPECIES: Ig-like domain-containing protein [unclassified Acidovorax]
MRKLFRILTVPLMAVLVACGGGGGDPGTSSSGGGSGGTAISGTVTVQAYSRVAGEDVAVSSFSSSDLTVRAKATVKDSSGNAIANAIVTFSESGPGLLAFMPGSATALTNSAGVAEIDLKAATVTSQGATQLVATTAVTSKTGTEVSLAGKQNLAISGGVVQDPQAAATAINFTSVAPSDKSIVIAGAGGNGRSEVALLTFTVVDSSGAPLQGVVVDFTAVPADSVTLNASSGTTNASGQVTATVNSKSSPTSVIIKAAVHGRSGISTQSDTLTVTTGVATQRGFDLSASKFNLDADLSGDSSTLTVRIVDENGNPVADGVPVVAQADFGRVGTSGRGGCTTVNGACSVEYTVQNPRPTDGTPVSVVFSTQTGQGTQISDTLRLWVSSVGGLSLYDTAASASPITDLTLTVTDAATCKFGSVNLFLGTPAGFAAPAGTTIAVRSLNDISTPAITDGSPTLDRAAATRTRLILSASGKSGSAGGRDRWLFTFTAGPSKTVSTVELPVTVPACPKAQ